MEMNRHKNIFWTGIRLLLTVLVGCLFQFNILAQPAKNGMFIAEGKAFLTLNKQTTEIELKSLSDYYELQELPLKDWVQGRNIVDTKKYGWNIEKQSDEWLVLSRSVEDIGDLSKLEKKILIASGHMPGDDLYPLGVYRKDFGYNKLRDPAAIAFNGKKVTIFMEGYKAASEVKIAGSFTRWEQGAIPMKKSAEGWYITLELEPGKHFYKFIADGNWLLHNTNKIKENDGRGNTNSVLYVPNYTFSLAGYQKASKVVVAGTFNGWAPNDAMLVKGASGWELPVYLPEGTYAYRFVVDNNWMADPANPEKLRNEFGEFNSVIKLGKPFIFRLDGFQNAVRCELVGSFNQWRKNDLVLQRRAGGWEIPVTLGQGNHEYYYLVDGNRVGRKPENEKMLKTGEPLNFCKVINPNHTFTLKGYKNATTVYLSGSFNNWSKTGFPMSFEDGEWRLKVNLPAGKQTYKFVVDDKWIIDPANPLWEQNEHATRNSVLWIENI